MATASNVHLPRTALSLDTRGESFTARRAHCASLVTELRRLEAESVAASAAARARFEKRGQLLPRDRLALLLDASAPWVELSTLAGIGVGTKAGAGVITGVGFIAGVRCLVNVSDSGIDAGAIQPMGREKILRGQMIALENRLPYVQLIESAGANLLKYRVEGFIEGGRIFYNLARLSAAGLPVIAVVHGSSTAGGAYMPGLSDHVVMVRERARAFLAGPPLLKAATGEIATEEELGGAQMHATISGLCEYLADDDAQAVSIARDIVANLGWNKPPEAAPGAGPMRMPTFGDDPLAPHHDPAELDGVMPIGFDEAIDMREVIARIVDRSAFLEAAPDYGPQTLCARAAIQRRPIGIITNNGPLDPAGANKATHFIQSCCQTATPLLFLQNTTGYLVGRRPEEDGMIKHGSKMIQAVSNATVPMVTLHCGASFGAGNYGMCGRSFGPRFVFSWPNARTAVMGGRQAATTMRIVAEAGAKRRGAPIDEPGLTELEGRIVENFERQQSAFHTSSLLLDDGVIDPRDTRRLLGFLLQTIAEGEARALQPMQFGVARP